jgi:hypothetical protein
LTSKYGGLLLIAVLIFPRIEAKPTLRFDSVCELINSAAAISNNSFVIVKGTLLSSTRHGQNISDPKSKECPLYQGHSGYVATIRVQTADRMTARDLKNFLEALDQKLPVWIQGHVAKEDCHEFLCDLAILVTDCKRIVK